MPPMIMILMKMMTKAIMPIQHGGDKAEERQSSTHVACDII